MKKLLFLIPNLAHGGAEKVLVNLVNNLDKTKYEVYVKTLFDTGVNKQYLHKDVHYIPGLKIQFRGNSHLFRLIPAKWLYKFFVKDHYDIIVSYLEGIPARILYGCTSKSTKRIAWVHIEFESEKKLSLGFKNSKTALKAYESFDKIVFVAKTVRKAFENIAGSECENGIVLYNTNETDLITQKATEPISDLVFNKNTINICSVGKIIETKGYDRLVHIHKRLTEEGYNNHHFYILGIGSQKNELEKYLNNNNLSDTFTFLGYRDNPYKYVAACDLYVCSSLREGFSTSVTESLIVGTPVVSTCCSGAYELLGDNNEYGIVTPNTEEGIYQGIKQMLDNNGLRKNYAKQAAVRGQKFSTKKTVAAVQEMFGSLYND